MPHFEKNILLGNNQVEVYSIDNSLKGDSAHENQDRFCIDEGYIGNKKSRHKFFQETVASLIKKHATTPEFKHSGSTICGILYDQSSNEVTVCNLGDSRAYIIFKTKRGKKILFSLSEDFRAETERFGKKIKEIGGEIEEHNYAYRIKGNEECPYGPGMAGCFGDNIIDKLLRTPDVTTFKISELINYLKSDPELAQEEFEADSIFVASDGISDFEKCLLKNSKEFKNNFFDRIYQLEIKEDGGLDPYRIVFDPELIKDAAEAKKVRSQLLDHMRTEMEYFDKARMELMRQDRMKRFNVEDKFTKHLAEISKAHGSVDDKTLVRIILNNHNTEINPETSQKLAVIADGHGIAGAKAAEEVVMHIKESFRIHCDEFQKKKPGATPSDAAADAAIEKLSINQPDV